MMDFFTEENYIEPFMRFYKDFKYVEFVLSLPFKDGFNLYLKCMENINEEAEEKIKNRWWDIYLQSQSNIDFETFYQSKKKEAEIKKMTAKQKSNIQDRIFDEINKIDENNIKLKERSFRL